MVNRKQRNFYFDQIENHRQKLYNLIEDGNMALTSQEIINSSKKVDEIIVKYIKETRNRGEKVK